MTDIPILFSGPMVEALLHGRKTKTRRVLKPRGPNVLAGLYKNIGREFVPIPRFILGDRLWVRETYFQRGHWEPVDGKRTEGGRQKWAFVPADAIVSFEEPGEFRKGRHHHDPATIAWHKRIGRFMPRRASRITLTVTDVRVERLQDISSDDCIGEGVTIDPAILISGLNGHCPLQQRRHYHETHVEAFRTLWTSINGPGSWEANPWVVVIGFSVSEKNIDA